MNFVYMTTNIVNGKKYIGKHSGQMDDSYLGSGVLLKQAIRKYGKENFARVTLGSAEDERSLDLLEMYFIEKYNAVEDPTFYNLTKGGTGGNTLANLSDEDLAARSEKYRAWLAKLSEEAKQALSQARSQKMKDLRKNPEIEARRLESLKKSIESRTPEENQKAYESRRGGRAYQAKPVQTPLGIFDCATNAAKAHEVTVGTVTNRCKNPKFEEWRFADGGSIEGVH